MPKDRSGLRAFDGFFVLERSGKCHHAWISWRLSATNPARKRPAGPTRAILKRSLRALLGIALVAAAPVAAQAPSMQNLYGKAVMEAAQQLGRQGFQMANRFDNGPFTQQWFRHPNSGRCVLLVARDNRTVSVEDRAPQECRDGGQPARPGRPMPGPGFNPGAGPGFGGGGDVYREFVGMRSRDADRELRRRGYRRVYERQGQQHWWHAERGMCASAYVQGGYVRQMTAEDPRACGGGFRPR